MKKVFLTGAGAPGAPGIIKALQQAGNEVFTGDKNPVASGRFLGSHFTTLPAADHAEFIPFILDLCRRLGIEFLLPIVTSQLLPFAEAKSLFKMNGIEVIVSDADQLRIANDKGRLYQHLVDKGLTVPEFRIVHTLDALIKAVAELGYPHTPVCLKPTISNGSRGVRILQEDADHFDLLFNHKPTHLYSSLTQIITAIGNEAFPPLLISEYLPGDEFTVDTIVQEGIPKLILPRVRTRMVQGISVQGTFLRQEEIIDYCNSILKTLTLSGPIGLQVKANVDGEFRLLEINPRLQGTSVAALGMGINLPALSVKQAFETVNVDVDKLPWGTSFVRYYNELFYQ